MTPHRRLLKHTMTHLSFLTIRKMVGAGPRVSGRSAEPVSVFVGFLVGRCLWMRIEFHPSL